MLGNRLARLGVLHGDWWKGAHLRTGYWLDQWPNWHLKIEGFCELYISDIYLYIYYRDIYIDIDISYARFDEFPQIWWHFQINNLGITFQIIPITIE